MTDVLLADIGTVTGQVTETIQRQVGQRVIDKGRKAVEKLTNRLGELKPEYVPINAIFPNPWNPNRQSEHEFDMLKLSIAEDGFTQPIIVHSKSMMIIDGEHRWRACHHLGFKEIAVVFVDMTDEQMRISTLRHNRARGSEDIERSIQILKDLSELGALDKAISGLDINESELSGLLSDLPAPEQMAGKEFSAGWVPDKTVEADQPERVGNDRRISLSENAVAQLTDMRDRRATMQQAGATQLEVRDFDFKSGTEVTQVTATFTNEDARVVREVLGDHPAQMIARLCVDKMLRNADMYNPEIVTFAHVVQEKWNKKNG